MTREQASNILDDYDVNFDGHTAEEIAEAFDMAFKALEQEPCKDAISRQAVETLVDELARAISDERCCISRGRSTATIMQDILDLPSVNLQEPKTGHWIVKEGREQGYDIAGVKTWYIQIMCDKCGLIKTAIEGHTAQYNYCPNCGAKMESEVRE